MKLALGADAPELGRFALGEPADDANRPPAARNGLRCDDPDRERDLGGHHRTAHAPSRALRRIAETKRDKMRRRRIAKTLERLRVGDKA